MRRPRSRWAGVRLRVTASAAIVTALGAVIAATLFLDGLHESLEGSLLTAAQEQADTVDAQLRAGADPRAVSVSSKDDLIIQILDSAGAIVATDHPHVRVPLTSSPGRLQDAQVSGLPDTYAVYARSSIDGKLVLVGLSEEQVDQADRTAFLWVIGSAPIGLALLAWVVDRFGGSAGPNGMVFDVFSRLGIRRFTDPGNRSLTRCRPQNFQWHF